VEQASQWSKQASGASKPVEQASQWSKQANGASKPVEQASQWSKRASGASKPVEQASQWSKRGKQASFFNFKFADSNCMFARKFNLHVCVILRLHLYLIIITVRCYIW